MGGKGGEEETEEIIVRRKGGGVDDKVDVVAEAPDEAVVKGDSRGSEFFCCLFEAILFVCLVCG